MGLVAAAIAGAGGGFEAGVWKEGILGVMLQPLPLDAKGTGVCLGGVSGRAPGISGIRLTRRQEVVSVAKSRSSETCSSSFSGSSGLRKSTGL